MSHILRCCQKQPASQSSLRMNEVCKSPHIKYLTHSITSALISDHMCSNQINITFYNSVVSYCTDNKSLDEAERENKEIK
jgi:hypothetical protein